MATKIDKAANIEKAIEWIKRQGYSDIKANIEGYDTPGAFQQTSTDTMLIPDITARTFEKKFYFEIAQKTDNVTELVTRWKLLSRMASYKKGQLCVFTPKGHKAFAEKLIEKNHISAKLIKM